MRECAGGKACGHIYDDGMDKCPACGNAESTFAPSAEDINHASLEIQATWSERVRREKAGYDPGPVEIPRCTEHQQGQRVRRGHSAE